MVVATLVALAPSASAAAGPVSVTNESTGDLCPNVSPGDSSEFPLQSAVTGGCVGHIVDSEGSVTLTAHIFGIESTDMVCDHEFNFRLGGNGEGYLTGISLIGPSCDRQPCGTAAGAPEAWEIHGEEVSAGNERLELHFCMENAPTGGGRTTCHLFIPFRDAGNHMYEFGTVNANDVPQEIGCEGFSGFRGEISGHWVMEDAGLEVTHPAR